MHSIWEVFGGGFAIGNRAWAWLVQGLQQQNTVDAYGAHCAIVCILFFQNCSHYSLESILWDRYDIWYHDVFFIISSKNWLSGYPYKAKGGRYHYSSCPTDGGASKRSSSHHLACETLRCTIQDGPQQKNLASVSTANVKGLFLPWSIDPTKIMYIYNLNLWLFLQDKFHSIRINWNSMKLPC